MAIDIKITSEQTIEHEGKQYRPVAIRSPKQNERYISPRGNLYIAGHGFSESAYVILEEVIPPYRTPTDEDAKLRPMAEFWDGCMQHNKPVSGVLLAVLSRNGWRFAGVVDDDVAVWQNCRIPNEGATE